jgi:hypothetical protein
MCSDDFEDMKEITLNEPVENIANKYLRRCKNLTKKVVEKSVENFVETL